MAYALGYWRVFRQVQITFRVVYLDCDLVLTGHLGSVGVGQVALRTVAQLRDSESAVLYSCDPVIGDRNDGVYVVDGLTAFFRDVALRAANILAPNQFELEVLAGCPAGALEGAPVSDTVAAAHALLERMHPGPWKPLVLHSRFLRMKRATSPRHDMHNLALCPIPLAIVRRVCVRCLLKPQITAVRSSSLSRCAR